MVAVNMIGLAAAPTLALWRARPSLVTGYPAAMLWRWLSAITVAVLAGALVVWQSGVDPDVLSRIGEIVWAMAIAALVSVVGLSTAWLLKVPDVRAGTRLLWRVSGAS